MDYKILAVFLGLFLASSFVTGTTVVLLNDTEPDIFALHQLTLSGDLAANELTISGSGEVVSGELVKVYLLGPSTDILIKDLRVNQKRMSVSFDDRGYFFLAEKGVFELSSDLEVRTIGQLRLKVPGPLNHLHFDLDNGHAIGGDRFGQFNQEVILQRWEKVSMVADGSFKYSFAERNSFHYLLNLQAYGSTLGSFDLDLPNGESVTSVTGAIKWAQEGSRLTLELTGERSSVTVRGYFNSNRLTVPLPEDRHHVLIESDPQKKITVSTNAEEIDISQSTLSPGYSNARAFIASRNQPISVQVKELGLLPSLAATVDSANQRIAITDKGSIIGELNYQYKNTGQDYIEFDVPGQPLYASTGSKPIKLTKDEKFLLAFPKTSDNRVNSFELVYFDSRNKLGFFDIIDIPIASSELPISTMNTQIYLPTDVYVLETLGAKGGSELPEASSAIFFLLIIGFLAGLVEKKKGFIIGYLIFSIGLLSLNGNLFFLLIAISIITILRRHISKDQFKWASAGAGLLIAGAIIIIVGIAFIFLIWQVGIFNMGAPMMSRSVSTAEYGGDYAMVEDEAMPVPQMKGLAVLGEGSGAISAPVREGVYPVKLQLPNLGKTIRVQNFLVTNENPVKLQVVLVSTWLKYLLYLVALLAGFKAYRIHKPPEKQKN
ncbi:MAG: hypothetical protein ABH950_04690 [Candidatus Altiarchaeota archaeon]